ncbi:MAG: 3'(2'),5'-bisphosphate nucleotidase CysQ [Pseudomonadota bacterium]
MNALEVDLQKGLETESLTPNEEPMLRMGPKKTKETERPVEISEQQEEKLIDAVRQAGVLAMSIYAREFTVEEKNDKSPVTEADLLVDKVLSGALATLFPDIALVTEEQADTHHAKLDDRPFFLVDPIDGTKEFVKKTGEFTINIGLIENRTPTFGIVYAPAIDRMFVGSKSACEICDGERKPISVSGCDGAMRAVASRSHRNEPTNAFLSANDIVETVSAGSSLKFCLLAAGEADVYPRFGPTMEWDTAAGHAVLLAAGGMVLLENGDSLLYSKPEFRNPNFIACSPDARRKCGYAE